MTHNEDSAVNSTEIAKLAGVSRSTVSKVLHNYPDIPEETKQRVMRVIQEHGYRPNGLVQALQDLSPKVMAIYFYDRWDKISNNSDISYYNLAMFNAIAREGKRRGYTIIYEPLFGNETEETIVTNINAAFNQHRISTAVFFGLDDNCHFVPKLANAERHIIVMDKEEPTDNGVRCLFSNDFQSMQRACEHLYENGFTRIMHIAGDELKLSGRERVRGYKDAIKKLQRAGKIDYEPLIIGGAYSLEAGYQAGLTFIKEKLYERYDGICCGCDMTVIGFLKCLHERGPELIDQLGLIGFDNEYVDKYVSPSVSTMTANYRNFAHIIFDLEQNYDEFKGGMKMTIDHELIVRDSSLPLKERMEHKHQAL